MPPDQLPDITAQPMLEAMAAFLTGSHAYGTPTPTSDFDAVFLVTPELSFILSQACEQGQQGSSGEFIDSASYRFGRLDMICCENRKFFEQVWKAGTDQLIARKPVTRAEAVQTFKMLMAEFWDRENALSLNGIVRIPGDEKGAEHVE